MTEETGRPLCLPCTRKGVPNLATCQYELLDGSRLYLCDTCKAALPGVVPGAHAHLAPVEGHEEARRLNKTASVSRWNQIPLRRDQTR